MAIIRRLDRNTGQYLGGLGIAHPAQIAEQSCVATTRA